MEKTETEEKTLSKKAEEVLKILREMSLLELNGLVKAMEKEFDIQPFTVPAPVSPAATPGGAAEAATVESEKSAYNIVLENAGDQKIAVIKAVRAVNPNLGLKEAKDLVDGAPKTVAENVPAEEAQKAKKLLEESGATVSLK